MIKVIRDGAIIFVNSNISCKALLLGYNAYPIKTPIQINAKLTLQKLIYLVQL